MNIITFLVSKTDCHFKGFNKAEEEIPVLFKRLRCAPLVPTLSFLRGMPALIAGVAGQLSLPHRQKCTTSSGQLAHMATIARRTTLARGTVERTSISGCIGADRAHVPRAQTASEPRVLLQYDTQAQTQPAFDSFDDESDKIFYQYVKEAYVQFLAGSDDFAELDRQYAQNHDAKASLLSGDIKKLEVSNAELDAAIKRMKTEPSPCQKLALKCSELQETRDKFAKLMVDLEVPSNPVCTLGLRAVQAQHPPPTLRAQPGNSWQACALAAPLHTPAAARWYGCCNIAC